VTASIDPYGRIVAQLPRKERAALVAPYALASVTTFTRGVAIVCLAMCDNFSGGAGSRASDFT